MSRTRGSSAGDLGLRGAHVGVVAEAGGDERVASSPACSRPSQRLAVERRRAAAHGGPAARRASGRRRRRRACPPRPRPRSRRPTAGCRRGSSWCRRAGRRSSAARSCRGVSEPSSPSMPSSGRAASSALADQLLGGDVGLGDEVGRAALRLDPQRRSGERRRAAGRPPRGRSRSASSITQRAGTRSAHGRCGLDLRGEREQRRLVAGAADELDGEREAVAGEAGGHRRGGLAGVVERRAVRHPARVAVERPQRAAALVGADRDRAAW